MKAVKRGAATGIIGLGILDGEDHNWRRINVKFAISKYDHRIQPKSIRSAEDALDFRDRDDHDLKKW